MSSKFAFSLVHLNFTKDATLSPSLEKGSERLTELGSTSEKKGAGGNGNVCVRGMVQLEWCGGLGAWKGWKGIRCDTFIG